MRTALCCLFVLAELDAPLSQQNLVFLWFWCKYHIHLLTLQLRHNLYLCNLLEGCCEAEKKNLALLLEDDASTAEEYISLNLCTLLDEVLGVTELEVEVVIVGLRTKTNLLDYNLSLLCLDLLLLLLLLIEEL